MFDQSTKLGITVLAILSVLSGVRILVDHFVPDGKVKSFVDKVVDFLSANVAHKN